MAYTRTTWASGNTITAAALNNMEEGIAALDNSVSDLQANVETLTEALDSSAADLAALDSSVSDLQASVETLTEALDGSVTELAALVGGDA
ncbi:MAG: hypothetical protein LUG45_10140 [Clostridiales bacterium]|nr:hypothetical protein [Clostridiales bacterium]